MQIQRRLDVTSDAAVRRVKRRYRAEARFRAYGMGAILFAALFLVILLADIGLKAIPAFTQTRLQLDLPVSAEFVNPEKPATGDFDAVVRDGLKALFPAVSTRAERKALSNILSSGAADYLRDAVVADPQIIGKSVSVPVLLSSDADLYLKGVTANRIAEAGNAEVVPSATTGSVTLTSSSAAFADQVQQVKEVMANNAAILTRELGILKTQSRSAAADLTVAEKRLADAKAGGDAANIALAEQNLVKIKANKDAVDNRLSLDSTTLDEFNKRLQVAGDTGTLDRKMPTVLIAINGGVVKAVDIAANRVQGDVLVQLASNAPAASGSWSKILIDTPEDSRKIQDQEVAYLEKLKEIGAVRTVVNLPFLTSGDSREPELAGILGALAGSAFTMLVTLLICLPVGVGAAIYLEEFAPKNRLTEVIEVNINNLAAVPSIVFGLLGLAMFLNFFGMPRSSPLVGGLVLALLVLPTIIIASRAALKAVPPSIREAALGIGASKQQAIFHHVMPLAMPGVLTGTIIGMAHALGESAPLLMIGMVAFIVDVPTHVTDAATVLPVQVFLWSDLPELGFKAKTAAAIIVLLMFLFVMNGLAIWLRKRFERRW
jgi:phosphate transport system permease protein